MHTAVLLDEPDQSGKLFLLQWISYHTCMQPGSHSYMDEAKTIKVTHVSTKVVRWIVMDEQLPIGYHQVPIMASIIKGGPSQIQKLMLSD